MCFNRYILRRHGFGDFLIPSLKGITFSCRVVRGGNFRTVILSNGCNLTSAVGIKGYCVLIDFPLCFNRYIFGRHGFGDFLIPSPKGITFSCRVVRGGNFRTVVLCNWCNLTSAVGIKGYCILINCPSGVQLQFPGHPVVKVPRLCEGAVRIPAVKGVPRFGGIIRLGNGRIQFVQHFDRPCHRTAARVEIDHTRGGLRPLCVQCNTHILIIRTCTFTVAVPVAFAAHKSIIPTKENIALALGHRHVAELLAVCNLYRFCYHLAAAGGVEGNRVGVRCPFCIQCYVIGDFIACIIPRRAVGIVPATEGIARCGGGSIGTRRESAGGKNLLCVFTVAVLVGHDDAGRIAVNIQTAVEEAPVNMAWIYTGSSADHRLAFEGGNTVIFCKTGDLTCLI